MCIQISEGIDLDRTRRGARRIEGAKERDMASRIRSVPLKNRHSALVRCRGQSRERGGAGRAGCVHGAALSGDAASRDFTWARFGGDAACSDTSLRGVRSQGLFPLYTVYAVSRFIWGVFDN